MKCYFRFISVLVLLCLSISLFAQQISPVKSNLVYTRVTSGLDVPQFEKGFTDFAFDDINMDGHLDLLSVGDHGSPLFNSDQHGIMVWFGDGQGNFSLHMQGHFGYGGIAVGDVNNDGFKDVGYGIHHNYATTNFGDQLIEVVLGDGTGMNWTVWDEGLATNGETWGMFGTAFADFNNNGYLDLVSTAFGCCAGLHVYLNQADGTWVPSFGNTGGNSGLMVRVGDINNDGNMDFIANHQQGIAWFGNGNGGFTNNDSGLPTGTSFRGIDVADVKNDGGTGLSFVNSSGGVEVYVWDDDIGTWVNFSENLPASGPYQLSQLFDMNSDGFVDVLAYGNRQFQLWLGDGTGNWAPDASFTLTGTPGNARALRVGGDFDNNGYPDLVILSQELSGGWIQFDQSRLYVFFEDSEADSLWVMAHHPKGHEKFHPGSVRFIEWISAVPENIPSMVKIEISAFGPEGPWWLVADSLPNNGRHQWTVPEIGSHECYLKLTVQTEENESMHITQLPFTIFGEPTAAGTPLDNKIALASLLPNPGSGIVEITSSQKIDMLTLYNSLGEKVAEIKKPGRLINLEYLPAGLYIYQLFFEDGNKVSGKWLRSI